MVMSKPLDRAIWISMYTELGCCWGYGKVESRAGDLVSCGLFLRLSGPQKT